MTETESSARPAQERDSRGTYPMTALAVTMVVQTLVSVGLSTPSVLAPTASSALGLPAQDVGWMVSTAYLAAMLSGLYGGGMSLRIGAVRLSQWSLLACGVALAAFSTGWPLALLAGAAMMGVGYGLPNPTAAEILSRHAPPRRRGLFFSIKQTGVPLGVAIAGGALPWLVGFSDWRSATAVLAAPMIVAAFAIGPSRGRLDSTRPGAARAPRVGVLKTFRRRLVGPLRDVFAYAPTRRLSITSLVYAFTQVCFLTFLVSLLTIEHGFSLALSAGVLATAQMVSVACRIAWGHVSDHWIDSTRLLGLLGVAMAVGIELLGLAPPSTPWPLMAGVALFCAATAVAWNGVYFSDLVRSVPPARVAEITGAMQFMTFMGGMSSSALFASLVGVAGGYGRVFSIFAALPAVTGIAMLRARGAWPKS